MTTVTHDSNVTTEDVDSFRQRARAWIRANLPPVEEHASRDLTSDEELAEVAHHKHLQRLLFDGGFAGIAVPKEYGGAGLTAAHATAFNEELVGHQFPSSIQVPNFAPCLPVILEFGTDEQKRQHVPAMLKGEATFVQFLSEPGGGSDVAGAQTTAVRDGDEWVINGSKIWTSNAWRSEWGLCLARTNWDVEKHRGLTVFMVPVDAPGIEMRRIEMASGTGPGHFCQEFFSDVRIPDANRIGDVDDGWSVGIRWMFYERSYHTSPYVMRYPGGGQMGSAGQDELVLLARKSGKINDSHVRDTIGDVRSLALVAPEASKRIYQGMRSGYLTDQGAALLRMLRGLTGSKQNTASMELAGIAGIAWTDEELDLGKVGLNFLTRQAAHIGGGSLEMARNVVSERVLGMPRERSGDRDIAYKDVPKGPPSH